MKKLTVTVKTPCQQNWSSMSEVPGGRFCASCQHQVIDFTGMNDRQMAEYILRSQGRVCGHFLKEQLEREIMIPRKPIPWMKYFVTIALPAFLVSLKTSAQPRLTGKVATIQNVVENNVSTKSLQQTDSTISGRVVDDTGISVPFASIAIRGKHTGAAADADGRFVLQARLGDTIQVSAVGFEMREQVVDKKDNLIVLVQAVSGEIVITGLMIPVKRKEVPLIQKIFHPAFTGFSVFPNPANSQGSIHISINKKPAGKYRVDIGNAAGVVVQSEVVNSAYGQFDIQLKNLAAGMYSVTLINTDNGKELSEKILIQ